jgi:2-polyprenyl-6-methoxyphenol hydroxylase-like FAD-dependent oxidoreductase
VLPAPWYDGHIILTGDAAHAVTPHLAQGAGMAMEDALILADELDKNSSVPEALAAFMTRRLPRVQFILSHAHEILLNEMESNAAKKAEFAAGLGARQAEITRALAAPA